MQKYYRGFSLIELLVVLAIIGIVSLIGVPSFNSAIRSSRLTTTVNDIVTDLSFARSEAIKRNQRVVMLKNQNNWAKGWTIFIDTDGNDALDGAGDDAACAAGSDCILQIRPTLSSNYTLKFTGSKSQDLIRYDSSGMIDSNNGTFYLCDNTDNNNRTEVNTAKLVVLNIIGRASVSPPPTVSVSCI
jgi:type IV fimbrial biogenesis protein FimT